MLLKFNDKIAIFNGRILGYDIILTPTPTATPTPTPTATPTPTPTPTATPTPTPTSQSTLYSNFNLYFIDGVRQATTYNLIRSNISTSRRLVVTATTIVRGFRFVRIPPDNWTQLNYGINPTLSIVAGTGASIDGGSSSKSFLGQTIVLNPSNQASRTNSTSQYDIYTMVPSNNSTTTLTPGEYNIQLIGATGTANFDMAILTNATFPINTSGTIFPSSTATTTHFAMEIF